MGGRDTVGIEPGCDQVQARAFGPLGSDSFDHLGGKERRTTSSRRYWARLGGSSLFGQQSLEFVDRDQLGAPGHLDRLDIGQHTPDEG